MKNIPLNEQVAKYIERLAMFEASQQKKAMLVGRMMVAMILPGYCGKLTDIERRTGMSRETFGCLLRDKGWDDSAIGAFLGVVAAEAAFAAAQEAAKPVIVCLDDTTDTREQPRSGAANPSEGMGFHRSHKDKKTVYGHQVAGMPIGATGGGFLCHGFRIYDKSKPKIELAQELAKSLHLAETVSYAVFDSWYANRKVIPYFRERGYEVVCALKTNRLVYPAGHKMQIKEFSKLVAEGECCLVTANSKKYYAYKFEAHLAGIANSAVLISWPEEGFGDEKKMRAFPCSDASLSEQEMVGIYIQRWGIEVFFKECKNAFGAKKIILRTLCGIRRHSSAFCCSFNCAICQSLLLLPLSGIIDTYTVKYSLSKLAKTLANHFDNILNYFDDRLTNAILEGTNNITQNLKTNARGFRYVEYFKTMIYFYSGDFNIDVDLVTHTK